MLFKLDFYAREFDRLLAAIFVGGLVLLVASAFMGTGGDLIVGDGRDYFEYARSMAIDGHLPRAHIKYPSGVAMIGMVGYWPMVLIGKGLMSLGALPTTSRWAAGWALPQQIAFCLPSIVLAFIACRANAGMMIRLGYSPNVVKPMVLFWIVATNIGFFMLKEPSMSESVTYSTLSLYYWALVRWFYRTPEERDGSLPASPIGWLRRAALTGLILGVAGTVRQQNILHCVALPLLLITQSHWLFGGDRRRDLLSSVRIVGTTACVSAAIFVLPWLAWFSADGELTLFSYGDEHFNFTSPHPLDALFHPGYHGLFVWHPAFGLAAIGLVLFCRQHRDLAAVWIVPILIQFYLISSWFWLSYGASIGHRGFFPVFPLLLAGWIAGADAFVRGERSSVVVSTVLLLTLVNAIVTALLITGRLNPMGLPPMSAVTGQLVRLTFFACL